MIILMGVAGAGKSMQSRSLADDYGYGKIETPILEYVDVFAKGIGKQTDIVEKEMFAFTDQGGDDFEQTQIHARQPRAIRAGRTGGKVPI